MSTVFMHAVVSVDGFIADAEDNVGPLFEWYFNGDAEIVDGGPFKVSRDSVRYVRPMWQRIGTTVMGRHLFDLTNGWEGSPPAGEHIVVVTHRPRPEGWHPEASVIVDAHTMRSREARQSAIVLLSTRCWLAGQVSVRLGPIAGVRAYWFPPRIAYAWRHAVITHALATSTALQLEDELRVRR